MIAAKQRLEPGGRLATSMRTASNKISEIAVREVMRGRPVANTDALLNPDAHLAAIKECLNRVRSRFRSAEHFEIEQIIDGRETRSHLCRWVNLARHSLRPGPSAFSYRP